MRVLGLLLLLLSFSATASEFDRYPAEHELTGSPAAPLLNTKHKRHYRTVLREAAKEGANFNGHYRIAYWGCGTNCIEWAVINLVSGHTWMGRQVESCWPRNATQPPPSDTPNWFRYAKTSSLIYVYSCIDEDGTATFNRQTAYAWQGSVPKKLRVDVVKY